MKNLIKEPEILISFVIVLLSFLITQNGVASVLNSEKTDQVKALMELLASPQLDNQAILNSSTMFFKEQDDLQVDPKKVALLLKKAEEGDADSQCLVGLLLFAPGASQEFYDAFRWFEKAARQNNADAQYFLGMMYFYGIGVSKDYIQAHKWLKTSADQKVVYSQLFLGKMYLIGTGVPLNLDQAFRWFEKAARQNNADAQYQLGIMHSKGKGVPKNKKEAISLLTKAAEQGHINAQYTAGLIYANGAEGVPINNKKAISLLTKAAEQGHPKAPFTLGLLYVETENSHDFVKAYAWLDVALSLGKKKARTFMTYISVKISPDQVIMGQDLSKELYKKIYAPQEQF